MIDLVQLPRHADAVKAAMPGGGVSPDTMDEILALDVEHRRRLQEVEGLRALVKELSRQVGVARRHNDAAGADSIAAASRALGDEERLLSEASEAVATKLRDILLTVPNVPDPRVPDGIDESDNVERKS